MSIRTRKMKALNPMQQGFVDSYLAMPLGEKDIEKAALDGGYSAHTAYAQGRKLLTHPLVRQKIMEETPSRAIELSRIDSAWMLSELANLWMTPLKSLFHVDGSIRSIHEMSEEAQRLIAGFEVHEIETTTEGNTTVVTRVGKIRIIDRLRALEDIGKHTKVNAFGTKEAADVNESFASLLRAATKTLTTSTLVELDITPEET